MNKRELIDAVALETGLTKVAVSNALSGFISAIEGELATGGEVALLGFGTFRADKRPARNGVNPATGEKLVIAPRTVPVFKAGAQLKAAVNP